MEEIKLIGSEEAVDLAKIALYKEGWEFYNCRSVEDGVYEYRLVRSKGGEK